MVYDILYYMVYGKYLGPEVVRKSLLRGLCMQCNGTCTLWGAAQSAKDPGALYWVAVEELHLSYHNMDINHWTMVIQFNLSSLTATQSTSILIAGSSFAVSRRRCRKVLQSALFSPGKVILHYLKDY